ncbi:MAG: RnfABCDGE type electron transport complex subunit D, partial [Longimicrobiales bacterium]
MSTRPVAPDPARLEAAVHGGRLELVASPHLKGPDSTARIMWTVVATLVPVVLVATWSFGFAALLVIGAATLGAVGTERLFGGRDAVADGSAAITGLLLGLTLPAGIPLWMAALGGAFGLGFGKLLFGGLGQNVFNPALVGRAFLQAAFPIALTTWPVPRQGLGTWVGDTFAVPLLSGGGGARARPTPRGQQVLDQGTPPLR